MTKFCFETLVSHAHDLLAKAQEPALKPTVIVGLSGGPDSVFLLHVLHVLHTQEKISLIAAHLNHGWREEAVLDEQFCIGLCKKLAIPIIVKHAKDLPAPRHNGSLEETGRFLRRTFFSQVILEKKALCLALAHHRQDQQETFLMRMIRGSTLSGLCCMQEFDYPYLRPLLHVNKSDIVAYLDAKNISYCHDHTNESLRFLRNKIRLTVLDNLRSVDDRVDEKFDTTINFLQEENEFLERLTQESFDRIFSRNTSGVLVGDVKHISALDLVLQRRLIMHWFIQEGVPFSVQASFLDEVLRFLTSPRGGSHEIVLSVFIHKKNNLCWLGKKPE